MTIISLKNVNLTRNKTEILKNITWQVNQGENWVILGLNGSGKSSLLKLILAEEWKSSGQLRVLGTEFGKGEIPKLRNESVWLAHLSLNDSIQISKPKI